MFGPGGALGDFGAKINIGYLCEFYSAAAWKELDTICRIRNDFAHNVKTIRFGISNVKDRCANLCLWQRFRHTPRDVHPERSSPDPCARVVPAHLCPRQTGGRAWTRQRVLLLETRGVQKLRAKPLDAFIEQWRHQVTRRAHPSQLI
jgi:hypothetical protein